MATKNAGRKEFARLEESMVSYTNHEQPRMPGSPHPNSPVGRKQRERSSLIESPLGTLMALVMVVVIPAYATAQISAAPGSPVQGLWVVPVWLGITVACIAVIVGFVLISFKVDDSEAHMESLMRTSGWKQYNQKAAAFHQEAKRRFGDENWERFCQIYGMQHPRLFYRKR